jgi:hypothetical protein
VDLSWYTPAEDFSLSSPFLTNDADHITNSTESLTASAVISSSSFFTNTTTFLTNTLGDLTAFAVLQEQKIKEYVIHRGETGDFVPSTLTALATVTAAAANTRMTYQDTSDPQTNVDIYYKLESIFELQEA